MPDINLRRNQMQPTEEQTTTTERNKIVLLMKNVSKLQEIKEKLQKIIIDQLINLSKIFSNLRIRL